MSFLLLDVRVEPVNALSWPALIALLVVVFVLAVGFVGALVALLVRYKRRRLSS
jgi:hypothetical protein